MSWTYSGDPASSDLDKYRFTISDTDSTDPLFQDEEIQYLIDEYGNSEATILYQLFHSAATRYAKSIKRSLGPQTEDPTERIKYFKEQEAYYRDQLLSRGISVPTYAYPKVFHRGMQNNPPWPPIWGS